MTSICRQIGIGCGKMFRRVLANELGLSAADAAWSYEVPLPSGKTKTLHLDGRVPLDAIRDGAKRERFRGWMRAAAFRAGVSAKVSDSLAGTVFEVRQGYKSKDSKRQHADIANAASAYANAYFPCAVILSTQIDGDILYRYRAERWAVVTGIVGENDPLRSTYDFARDVLGYDLAAFFRRNSETLRAEVDTVLKALLTPEAT